ncbi:cold shock domain-containing protein, partial [Acinetobacter lwoffii]|uniref:cold shock domain-containing protein n=1 Tax=Acinetobacter lwoffii TaxID=28090 RepID=UPI0020908DC8
MFQEGKIKTYNEDRGFGFIQIEGQSKDLFFHVKDFPNKNVPPRIGEKLKFFSVHDKFHRTLILSGFCLLKIAKISL